MSHSARGGGLTPNETLSLSNGKFVFDHGPKVHDQKQLYRLNETKSHSALNFYPPARMRHLKKQKKAKKPYETAGQISKPLNEILPHSSS